MVASVEWSDYADYLVSLGLSPKTVRIYCRWVKEAAEWLANRGQTLAKVGATELAAFATDRIANSHSSRGAAHSALTHYWDFIDRPRPPHRAIRVPPAPEMVCQAIEPQQARDLVKISVGWYPQGLAVLVGMYLALRRFEIAKMEWSRFSDDRTWYRVTGKYSKTATLPVHPLLQAELPTAINGSPWIFPGRFPGRHVTPATIWSWIREAGEAADIAHLRPHQLRHTSLATANDNTGNLRAVQTFARHSKPSTTSGYTRTTAAKLQQISESLDYLGDA